MTDPNVTVIVVDPVSHAFYALGEAKKPREYPLHSSEVLSQALVQASGLTGFADASEVKLIRHTPTRDVEVIVNYDLIRTENDLSADISVNPDDTISAPYHDSGNLQWSIRGDVAASYNGRRRPLYVDPGFSIARGTQLFDDNTTPAPTHANSDFIMNILVGAQINFFNSACEGHFEYETTRLRMNDTFLTTSSTSLLFSFESMANANPSLNAQAALALLLWRNGLCMIEAPPLVGIGLDQFKSQIGYYNSAFYSVFNRNYIAHNTYIYVAAEEGLPLLAVFLMMIWLSLRACRFAERSAVNEPIAAFASAIQVGLLAFLIARAFLSAQLVKPLWVFVPLSQNVREIARALALFAREPKSRGAAARPEPTALRRTPPARRAN